MRCLCSVVIPTHNRASLLRECLESVAAQTYRPLEIIIADDGSTDDTESVVASFREQIRPQSSLNLVYLRLPARARPRRATPALRAPPASLFNMWIRMTCFIRAKSNCTWRLSRPTPRWNSCGAHTRNLTA